jgi:hypothetical protein
MANNKDIEGIIKNIDNLEIVLTNTIKFTGDPMIRLNAQNELKKLKDIKKMYIGYTNSLYLDTVSYDTASRELIEFQNRAYDQLQGVNDILNVEQMMALRAIDNKKRMVQINTYYSNKYADYIFISKMIILLCAIIIILSMLARRSIITRGIYAFLVIISCSIIVCVVIIRWISMRYRDTIDYNKYKFYVPPYKPSGSGKRAGYTESDGILDASRILSRDNGGGMDGDTDGDMDMNGGNMSAIIMDI